MTMKTLRSRLSRKNGFALIYMAATLTVLLLFTGVAVDSGRAYVVKAQLTKAVDGAALAAARNLNSGAPRTEAGAVIKTDILLGLLGKTLWGTDTAAEPFVSPAATSTRATHIYA